MVKVKFRRSDGSGKCVFIVDDNSSSVRSVEVVLNRSLRQMYHIEEFCGNATQHLSAHGSEQHLSWVSSSLPRPHSSSYSISRRFAALAP